MPNIENDGSLTAEQINHFYMLISGTDYDLLHKQLHCLYKIQPQFENSLETFDALEGLIAFIEYILDTAEAAGLFKYPEPNV